MSRGSMNSSNFKPANSSKDFNAAYRDLVQQMYIEQGSISGLVTEEELIKVQSYKNLNEKDFLQKQNEFIQRK